MHAWTSIALLCRAIHDYNDSETELDERNSQTADGTRITATTSML